MKKLKRLSTEEKGDLFLLNLRKVKKGEKDPFLHDLLRNKGIYFDCQTDLDNVVDLLEKRGYIRKCEPIKENYLDRFDEKWKKSKLLVGIYLCFKFLKMCYPLNRFYFFYLLLN